MASNIWKRTFRVFESTITQPTCVLGSFERMETPKAKEVKYSTHEGWKRKKRSKLHKTFSAWKPNCARSISCQFLVKGLRPGPNIDWTGMYAHMSRTQWQFGSTKTIKRTPVWVKRRTEFSRTNLYSTANDPRPQMIPRPEMIPKLDRKWSRTSNDPRFGPQMIPSENEERHGASFHVFIYSFYFHHPNDKCKEKILTT